MTIMTKYLSSGVPDSLLISYMASESQFYHLEFEMDSYPVSVI